MPFKMTHTDERYLQCIRDAFRITQPYQKRAGKTGALRDGNGANIAPAERSLLKRLPVQNSTPSPCRERTP